MFKTTIKPNKSKLKYTTALSKIFIVWMCLLMKYDAQSSKYPILNFSPVDYKAGIQNIDFAQNRDMQIFVANNLGVLSYNGSEWKVHNTETGKKQRSLAFDEDTRRLYVGSQGEFGYFYDDWKYQSLVDLIPLNERDFDEVWDVFQVDSDTYFCTFQGIFKYDGEKIYKIGNEEGFDKSFKIGGKLITQDKQGQLYEVKGDELVPLANQTSKNQLVAGIIEKEGGSLIIYKSGKIEMLSLFESNQPYGLLERTLLGKYINHVLQLADSRLVVCTQTSGIFIYDFKDGTINNISKSEGLLSNACLRAFQDHFGSLWIGSQNGVSLIDINSPMRFLNQEIGIEGSGYAVFETEDGSYYSTSSGFFFLAKGSSESQFIPGTEGPGYDIQKIGKYIYGCHQTGVFLLQSGRSVSVTNEDGFWKLKPLKSRPGYFVGGGYNGLYIFKLDKEQKLSFYKKVAGFNESSRFFEEDQEGNIWVGQYYKGLFKIELSQDLQVINIINASDEYNLPFSNQLILTCIDDELYVGSKKGVYKLDTRTNQIQRASLFDDIIGEEPIYLIESDEQKNIHILSKSKVGFFKQISPNNYAFVPSSLYQLRYFLNNDLLHVSSRNKDGIYFSANEGFLYYNPKLEPRSAARVPLIVNKVHDVSSGKNLLALNPFDPLVQDALELEIERGVKDIKLSIESYQFNNVNQKAFSYFLEGFDEDFSDVSNASMKEYTNLPEGEYNFRIKTKDNLGKEYESSPLKLKVKPPIYRTLGAKASYIALGILSLIIVARIQKRRYEKREAEVRAKSQLEIEKKERTIEEIADKKEMELLKLKEENMKNELSHVNNQLATTTMNLVVKNDFITTIRSELKDIKEKDSKSAKLALDRLVREIDTTLRVQEDWEQFEYHFDQVHGDFLTRLRNEFQDLTPSEQKLCAFLKLNLSTKEIANLLSISIRGVEVARYRLRKKLKLQKGQNLSKFIIEY